jgi:nitroimidazol reductase NimA-like FMN-containing flavoprotein (pyridoxamine 5'-phosphate oxidase superfamily)
MTLDDEPVFGRDFNDLGSEDHETEPVDRVIRRLVVSAPFAVLCTQGQGQPYGSLVAFAFSEDLTTAVFATPQATRKYRLLSECDRMALLIDNRPKHADNMMQVEAVTVTGRATEIQPGALFERFANMLIGRHPYLKSFVWSESCALFRVDAKRFLHVCRFQEVRQWIPQRP